LMIVSLIINQAAFSDVKNALKITIVKMLSTIFADRYASEAGLHVNWLHAY